MRGKWVLGGSRICVVLALAWALTAVANARTDSNPELAALYQADQAARQADLSLRENIEQLVRGDRARRHRVREMLAAGEVRTGQDFSRAALIFQHGENEADYLLARDLAVIASLKGRFDSMPAYAMDRWLRSIGQPQRFRTQFGGGSGPNLSLQPADSDPRTGVTDELAAAFGVPPLAWMESAMKGKPDDALLAPLRERLVRAKDPKALARALSSPLTQRLAAWSRRPTSAARGKVIELYRRNSLEHPAHFASAARVLLSSRARGELQLAADFATLAVMRGERSALPVYREAFDKVLESFGRTPRYASSGFRSNQALYRELGGRSVTDDDPSRRIR